MWGRDSKINIEKGICADVALAPVGDGAQVVQGKREREAKNDAFQYFPAIFLCYFVRRQIFGHRTPLPLGFPIKKEKGRQRTRQPHIAVIWPLPVTVYPEDRVAPPTPSSVPPAEKTVHQLNKMARNSQSSRSAPTVKQ